MQPSQAEPPSAWRRRRSPVADEGNGGACDVQGLPASDGSVRRKRGTRRSPWACQRGEVVAAATANGVGGDGRACERETEEGMRRGRVREGVGAAWRHPGTGSGRTTSLQREAGGRQSRVEVSRAAVARVSGRRRLGPAGLIFLKKKDNSDVHKK